MTVRAELDDLRRIVREFHVHYDVEPELEVVGTARRKIATIVRLWGVHPRGARALPGCPQCVAIHSQLKRIAAFALDHPGAAIEIAIEPLRLALYDSRVVPDADEIALPIRLSFGPVSAGGGDDRCLRGIRARLRELEIPER